MSRIIWVILITLKVLNFAIFAKLFTREKFQNHKIAKLNTREIKYMTSFKFSFSYYLTKV